MKLYGYFIVDIEISKYVKISAGRAFSNLSANKEKGYIKDFPQFDIITEPADSPVKRLKN